MSVLAVPVYLHNQVLTTDFITDTEVEYGRRVNDMFQKIYYFNYTRPLASSFQSPVPDVQHCPIKSIHILLKYQHTHILNLTNRLIGGNSC